MAAPDVAPQFGAELKVYIGACIACDPRLTHHALIGLIQTSQCLGMSPDYLRPFQRRVMATFLGRSELMHPRCTGIEWHILARRDTAILPRTKCYRKRICVQAIGPLQEIP